MSPKVRWAILGGLLTFTLAATALVREEDAAEPGKKARAERRRAPAQEANGASVRTVASVRVVPEARDARSDIPAFPERKPPAAEGEGAPEFFAVKSWYVAPPPPPVVAPPPPPKPKAPPLPFVFMGRMSDPAGGMVVYLVKGDRTFPVKGGETLENLYQVEKISAGEIEFVYLPLKEKQVLAIGAPPQ